MVFEGFYMTPITPYRINSNYNSAENSDENDARNKRDIKRKLVRRLPVILQADPKNSEKILSEAMQLASSKSKYPFKFDEISKVAEIDYSDYFHSASESGSTSQINSEKNIDNFQNNSDDKSEFGTESDNNTHICSNISNYSEVDINSNFRNSVNKTRIDAICSENEDDFLSLSNFAKNIIFLESIVTGLNKRSDPLLVLKQLEKIASFLSDQEKVIEPVKKERNIDFNREDMSCSLEFIEGYCEASSFSSDMKEKISRELNKIKELMDEISTSLMVISAPIMSTAAFQNSNISNKNLSDLKSVSKRVNINNQDKDFEKKHDDTLPITTLRSI